MLHADHWVLSIFLVHFLTFKPPMQLVCFIAVKGILTTEVAV